MNFSGAVKVVADPFTAGYLYGTTLGVTKEDFKEELTTSPFMTTFDVLARAGLYGVTAEFLSRTVVPEKAKMVLSLVLLGVSGYKLYSSLKQKEA
jgi:hypothetical protein